MEIIRRKKILVKIERRLVARSGENSETIFCRLCVGEMIHAQSAADLLGISSREIYRCIEAEKIHFFENEKKQVYVCPLSLKSIWGNNFDAFDDSLEK